MDDRVLDPAAPRVIETFEGMLAARGYVADTTQRAAVRRLQRLYSELVAFKNARRSTLRKFFSRPTLPRGVYLWGGVGRGKSFIMDCFYEVLPYQRKRRMHFHAFMQEVHGALRQFRDVPDPLLRVADQIALRTRLFCFDEFHVSDIADAMILSRLLNALLERGVIFVMTSNYPPDGLYPGGLQRQNFLPTITLLKNRFDVLEIDHGTDYRLRTLDGVEVYLVPGGAMADAQLARDFARLAGGPAEASEISLFDRVVPTQGARDGVVWFEFSMLCMGARSQNDYLELARHYHTLILSDVPVMTREEGNEARRFTWLVDILYDHRVKLLISAAAPAYDLYREGPNAQEFPRTVSRLVEMRSRQYLAEPHRLA